MLLITDVSEADKYGRLLRYVLVDGIFINYRLVWDGFAQAVTYPPDVACTDTFNQAEAEGRENCSGLWCEGE